MVFPRYRKKSISHTQWCAFMCPQWVVSRSFLYNCLFGKIAWVWLAHWEQIEAWARHSDLCKYQHLQSTVDEKSLKMHNWYWQKYKCTFFVTQIFLYFWPFSKRFFQTNPIKIKSKKDAEKLGQKYYVTYCASLNWQTYTKDEIFCWNYPRTVRKLEGLKKIALFGK